MYPVPLSTIIEHIAHEYSIIAWNEVLDVIVLGSNLKFRDIFADICMNIELWTLDRII